MLYNHTEIPSGGSCFFLTIQRSHQASGGSFVLVLNRNSQSSGFDESMLTYFKVLIYALVGLISISLLFAK